MLPVTLNVMRGEPQRHSARCDFNVLAGSELWASIYEATMTRDICSVELPNMRNANERYRDRQAVLRSSLHADAEVRITLELCAVSLCKGR
jgi:hypothetical protein